jgi:hypothetical protein
MGRLLGADTTKAAGPSVVRRRGCVPQAVEMRLGDLVGAPGYAACPGDLVFIVR